MNTYVLLGLIVVIIRILAFALFCFTVAQEWEQGQVGFFSGFTDSQVPISYQTTFSSLLILVDWVSYHNNKRNTFETTTKKSPTISLREFTVHSSSLWPCEKSVPITLWSEIFFFSSNSGRLFLKQKLHLDWLNMFAFLRPVLCGAFCWVRKEVLSAWFCSGSTITWPILWCSAWPCAGHLGMNWDTGTFQSCPPCCMLPQVAENVPGLLRGHGGTWAFRCLGCFEWVSVGCEDWLLGGENVDPALKSRSGVRNGSVRTQVLVSLVFLHQGIW